MVHKSFLSNICLKQFISLIYDLKIKHSPIFQFLFFPKFIVVNYQWQNQTSANDFARRREEVKNMECTIALRSHISCCEKFTSTNYNLYLYNCFYYFLNLFFLLPHPFFCIYNFLQCFFTFNFVLLPFLFHFQLYLLL